MRLRSLLPAALLLAATFAAHADTFAFASSAGSFRFSLPGNPTPSFVVTGDGFQIDNVSASFPSGAVETINTAFFDASGPGDGGFAFQATMGTTSSFSFSGLQEFSGTEANPMFLTGIYDLTDNAGNIQGATLTITDSSVSAVPEPSTFVLLGSGLFGLAGMARRRFCLGSSSNS